MGPVILHFGAIENTTNTSLRGTLTGGFTFTFPDGSVKGVTPNVSTDVSEFQMPSSAPLSNIGLDFSGVAKTISISGQLINSDVSVVSNNSTIKTALQQKYWLEALQNGNQSAPNFPMYITTNQEMWSMVSSSGTTTNVLVDGEYITLPGTWRRTRAYIKRFSASESEGIYDRIEFTLDLYVAGL